MRKVTLEVAGYKFEPEIRVDGKLIRAKKNKEKRMVYTLETEKSELELDIYKWYEEESKLWLLMTIVFYLISLFGILDIKKEKFCRSLKYKGKLLLPEDKEYNTKIFTEPTLKGRFGFNAIATEKHIYDHLLYDSEIDQRRPFAEDRRIQDQQL